MNYSINRIKLIFLLKIGSYKSFLRVASVERLFFSLLRKRVTYVRKGYLSVKIFTDVSKDNELKFMIKI